MCSIFIDLQKAFDTVSHQILLQKLFRYGIRGTAYELMRSYLENRLQCTICNGCRSEYSVVECGVPQGSTLGPLLFLIFINDLHSSSIFDLNLFADDACLTLSNMCPQKLESLVNNELNKIVYWLEINKLALNVKKTHYLIFANKKSPPSVQIYIKDEPLVSFTCQLRRGYY